MARGLFPMNGREFAAHLKVNERSLRAAIRKYRLMPGHVPGALYEIEGDDAARLAADPHIARLPRIL